MRAEHHSRQAERLATLRHYQILDTPREADFDEIVNLVSQICETPISVINLIDADRQWFKAEIGLGERETPLETSICSHIILDQDFVEIPDTLADRRLADNPLCLAEPDGLRFYAGARLVAPDGMPIGTLCVLDTVPRELTGLQRETLRVMARQVMTLLEFRLALRNRDVLHAEMDHRVKNSLQTISATTRLYARTVTDEAASRALAAIQRRVDAVGALHRELQDSAHSDDVALDAYLSRIVTHLQDTAPDNVTISLAADALLVSSRRASAVGVIVSECVANAIKHAFPDQRAGVVDISLCAPCGGDAVLTCRDDGVGSTGASPRTPEDDGIGMALCEAAAAELGAVLQSEIGPDGGELTLTFPASTQRLPDEAA